MFDDAEDSSRRRLVGELCAAAATAAARPHRGVLLAAVSELERCGARLGALGAVLGGSSLVEAALALRSDANASLAVVYGNELGDSDGSCWIARAVRDGAEAHEFARDLNGLVERFGDSIGKPDLVGLDPLERKELASHVALKDPRVRVGRHGVKWTVDRLEVDR